MAKPSGSPPKENELSSIQEDIEARASVAPRVTPTDVEAEIVSEHYFTAYDGRQGALVHETYSGRERPAGDGSDLIPLTLLTICVLVLRNGFTVTGESSCASPENFDADIGRRVARQNAVNKVWPLLGFRLRDRLVKGAP